MEIFIVYARHTQPKERHSLPFGAPSTFCLKFRSFNAVKRGFLPAAAWAFWKDTAGAFLAPRLTEGFCSRTPPSGQGDPVYDSPSSKGAGFIDLGCGTAKDPQRLAEPGGSKVTRCALRPAAGKVRLSALGLGISALLVGRPWERTQALGEFPTKGPLSRRRFILSRGLKVKQEREQKRAPQNSSETFTPPPPQTDGWAGTPALQPKPQPPRSSRDGDHRSGSNKVTSHPGPKSLISTRPHPISSPKSLFGHFLLSMPAWRPTPRKVRGRFLSGARFRVCPTLKPPPAQRTSSLRPGTYENCKGVLCYGIRKGISISIGLGGPDNEPSSPGAALGSPPASASSSLCPSSSSSSSGCWESCQGWVGEFGRQSGTERAGAAHASRRPPGSAACAVSASSPSPSPSPSPHALLWGLSLSRRPGVSLEKVKRGGSGRPQGRGRGLPGRAALHGPTRRPLPALATRAPQALRLPRERKSLTDSHSSGHRAPPSSGLHARLSDLVTHAFLRWEEAKTLKPGAAASLGAAGRLRWSRGEGPAEARRLERQRPKQGPAPTDTPCPKPALRKSAPQAEAEIRKPAPDQVQESKAEISLGMRPWLAGPWPRLPPRPLPAASALERRAEALVPAGQPPALGAKELGKARRRKVEGGHRQRRSSPPARGRTGPATSQPAAAGPRSPRHLGYPSEETRSFLFLLPSPLPLSP
ncbi:uncharacterized protein LOC144579679 [Callithrix jacchus]